MGIGLWVALQKKVPGVDSTSMYSKPLAGAQDKLGKIARKLKLRPFSDFLSFDPNEMADYLEGCGGSWSAIIEDLADAALDVESMIERAGGKIKSSAQKDRTKQVATMRAHAAELDEASRGPEEWFYAADGLKTVQGLIAHLKSGLKRSEADKYLVRDLRQAEKILKAAQKRKVKFHFTHDMP